MRVQYVARIRGGSGSDEIAVEGNSGQVLVIYALALPVALGFCALVVDLGASYVEKRSLQQAADAAALAAAQELQPALGTCDAACMAAVNAGRAPRRTVQRGQRRPEYGPTMRVGHRPDTCYTWPYKGSNSLVQVRLNTTSNIYFAGIFGVQPGFLKPAVKAVAKATAITENHCSFPPGTQFPPGTSADDYLNTTPPCTIPEQPGPHNNGGSEGCLFPNGTVFPGGTGPSDYVHTTPPCTIPPTSAATGVKQCGEWTPSSSLPPHRIQTRTSRHASPHLSAASMARSPRS